MYISKKIINWFLVFLWAVLIFYMSSMNTKESNNKSKGTIQKAIVTTVNTTNKLGITDKHFSKEDIKRIVLYLNHPLRKCVHIFEFGILTILLINAFIQSNVKGYKVFIFSILICFLYACTDEFHQLYIDGRTGQFRDVLIDTIGISIGLILYLIKNKVKCYNK